MLDSKACSRAVLRFFVSIGLLFLVTSMTSAQTVRPASIADDAASYFAAHAANGDFSGQVVIARHGEIVYEGAFGVTDVSTGTPVTMETRFVIASVTKTLTAATILMLERDGLLDRNDRLSTFLPDYPQADAITPRLLMLFASGIGNPEFDELSNGPRLTSGELILHLAQQPFGFIPGTSSQYSNGNYNVLARVIEVATKRSYGDVLRTSILEPLGMRDTEDGSVTTAIDRLAVGHTPGPGAHKMVSTTPPRLDLSVGSGALVSTARDIARWGHAVATSRFIDLAALEYPYGWGRTDDHGVSGYEQTGAMRGYMSVLRVHPEEGWVIAVLANTEYGQWTQWGSQMTRLIVTREFDLPESRPKPVRLTDAQITNAVGRYKNDNQFLDVRVRDGHLWVHIGGDATGKYMARLGESNRFDVPADFFRVEFDALESSAASIITTTYPGGGDRYERVADPDN